MMMIIGYHYHQMIEWKENWTTTTSRSSRWKKHKHKNKIPFAKRHLKQKSCQDDLFFFSLLLEPKAVWSSFVLMIHDDYKKKIKHLKKEDTQEHPSPEPLLSSPTDLVDLQVMKMGEDSCHSRPFISFPCISFLVPRYFFHYLFLCQSLVISCFCFTFTFISNYSSRNKKWQSLRWLD